MYGTCYVKCHTRQRDIKHPMFWLSFIIVDLIITELLANTATLVCLAAARYEKTSYYFIQLSFREPSAH